MTTEHMAKKRCSDFNVLLNHVAYSSFGLYRIIIQWFDSPVSSIIDFNGYDEAMAEYKKIIS